MRWKRFSWALLFAAATLAGAAWAEPNILLLNEQCGASYPQYPEALFHLGLTYTETDNTDDFDAALSDGTAWDLVIVDDYGDQLPETVRNELASYVASGGRVAIDYSLWAGDGAFSAVFEAATVSDYTVPADIHQWSTAGGLFTSPNVVPDPLVPSGDDCAEDGALFEPIGGGQAVAGYAAASTTNQAAIVVGNGGRTILFGGILGLYAGDSDDDGTSDGQELARNFIYLLSSPVFSDGFESGDITLWSSCAP